MLEACFFLHDRQHGQIQGTDLKYCDLRMRSNSFHMKRCNFRRSNPGRFGEVLRSQAAQCLLLFVLSCSVLFVCCLFVVCCVVLCLSVCCVCTLVEKRKVKSISESMALHSLLPLRGARAAIKELLFVWLFLGRLFWVCSGVCVCVCVRVCVCVWDEALKAVGCELTVAEHARLVGFGRLA